jgi:hypothetical protein
VLSSLRFLINISTLFRYATLLPQAHILFCNIISEFGKSRDLVSALKAYDAIKKKLERPNMYIYRAIIDTCGLCGGFMKSRYIYEVFFNQFTFSYLNLYAEI